MSPRWRRLLNSQETTTAIKAGMATGVAYFLGGLLPDPLGEYGYYAALGAFVVVGLVVVDSLAESLRVTCAVVLGVAIAVGVQHMAGAHAWVVGGAVLLSTLLASLLPLGVQRTWVPVAALFVLATGGAEPEPMALGYVVQVPLGALIGIAVNAVVFAPLVVDRLEQETASMYALLGASLARYAERMETEGDGVIGVGDPHAHGSGTSGHELQDAQSRLRASIVQAARARRGNPRLVLRRTEGGSGHSRALARAEAAHRCAAALVASEVLLEQSGSVASSQARDLREQVAVVLRLASDIFADRIEPGAADRVRGRVQLAVDRAWEQVGQLRAAPAGPAVEGVLLGALVLAVQECLATLAWPSGPG